MPGRERDPGRVSIRSVLALALSAAVVLLVLELTARVYLFGLAGLDPRKVQSLRDFRETEFVRSSENEALGFEHVPNTTGFFKLVPYRTNSAGMRDDEYTLEKPTSTFRVAVLGSSFTVPTGVRIEDSFHSLMEERLSAERRPTRYEFLNFAIGAYHPRQVLALLRSRALRYDPDLILFATTSLSMRLLLTDPAVLRGGHRSGLRPPSNPFFRSYLLALIELRTGDLDPRIKTNYRSKSISGETILTALGTLSRENGIPVVVVRLEFDPERPSDGEGKVIRAARAAGLYFLDTRESFAGMQPKELWIHEMDPHPNAVAHDVFAKALTAFLDSHALLDRKLD